MFRNANCLTQDFFQIQRWLGSYIEASGCEGVVIGLSGGFDSSFAAYLTRINGFLSEEKVKGIMMPCQSSEDSLIDARDVAKQLKFHAYCVDLTQTVEDYVSMLRKSTQEQLLAFETGNVKARMRMVTLYAVASRFNFLVLNTTNFSELMTGNGTKFGDGAGDISPFLNYTKTELYEMADMLGFSALFPQIRAKVPTADLEPNQTDEKTMGVSYATLDAYLRGAASQKGFYDYKGHKVRITKADEAKILKKITRNAHKWLSMPSFKFTTDFTPTFLLRPQ